MYELNPSLIDGQPVIPLDLASAIAELDRMLPAPLKSKIKDDGADSQHRSLGMWIRNNWGLWDAKQVQGNDSLQGYFLARGIKDPDSMSSVVLDCYCAYLRGQDVIEPPLLSGDELLRATRSVRLQAFFQSLVDVARREGFICARNVLPQHWTNFSTGIRTVGFYASFTRTMLIVAVSFQSQSDEVNKARFDAIVVNRDEVDKALERKLSWERCDGRVGSRIALYHDGSIDSQPDELNALCAWAIGEMKLMREMLLPQVLKVVEQTS